MPETIDRNFMIAQLRALDADALYERSKLLIRIGNRFGLSTVDRLWRDLLAAEWRRRGNYERYLQAFRDVAAAKEEERAANVRAAAKWGRKQQET
jgi:hypothetical protein